MNSTVRLLATGSYVPEKVLANADFEKMVDTSDEWIVSRTGIKERRVVSEGEATSDLAVRSARQALDAAGLKPEEIDHLVLCTFTPDMPLPASACIVQNSLGAVNASAVDLAAACTGFIAGLSHGTGMIASGQAEKVLVIAAESLSRFTDYQDRGTCVLFGDGSGAAVLVADQGGHRLSDVRIYADGSGVDPLHIPGGGSLRPASNETVAERQHFIKMRGREVFKFAVQKMIGLIKDAAERRGIEPAEFNLVVPHQVNQRIIQAAIDRLGMRQEQFFCNLERYGNTSGASVAIALDEAVREGRLKEGDHALMVVFGAGFTWGSAELDW